MEKKTYKEYLSMKENELCREYRERYGVRWPDRPEDVEVDENLFEAISWKLRQGK